VQQQAVAVAAVDHGDHERLIIAGALAGGALELHRKHLDTDASDFVDGMLKAYATA